MATKNNSFSLTKGQISKMYLMWHKNNDEPPKNSEDWYAYLMSIQTNSLKSKRSFPDVLDINSLQLNRHFFWMIRSALINDNKDQLKKAFLFYTNLRKARADYRTEIMDTSIRKVTALQKLFGE